MFRLNAMDKFKKKLFLEHPNPHLLLTYLDMIVSPDLLIPRAKVTTIKRLTSGFYLIEVHNMVKSGEYVIQIINKTIFFVALQSVYF